MSDSEACYVLFQVKQNAWILMSYVPDKAKVKDKMLYASTRATVKRLLGANSFCDELHGTVASDVSAAGYEAHKAHVGAAQPLTNAEFARQEELELGEIYTGGSSTYVHGVAFPATGEVTSALKQLVSGGNNYVCLGVDVAKETIVLNKSKSLTLGALKTEVSLTEPQFHFLRHVHASFDETIFVFTCPDGSGKTKACPIKQRMLYSSSKARVVSLLTEAGGKVEKSFEFNEPNDIVETDINEALHPRAAPMPSQIVRPARPGRGPRALLRTEKK